MDKSNDAQQGGQLVFGLRVRDLRVRAGMTQGELADRIQTTKATISKIERSTKSPKLDWIERLADGLNVSVGALAFGSSLSTTAIDSVPVIGLVAAGNWREAIQTPDGFIPIVGAKPHMFALQVNGDSLDNIAPDGSFVAIDPTSPGLSEGAVYVVQNADGEATLKRYRRNPERLEPDSTNPEHKPIYLGEEPVTIIGRATSVIRAI